METAEHQGSMLKLQAAIRFADITNNFVDFIVIIQMVNCDHVIMITIALTTLDPYDRYGEEDLAGAKSLVDQCPADDPDTDINLACLLYKEGRYSVASPSPPCSSSLSSPCSPRLS